MKRPNPSRIPPRTANSTIACATAALLLAAACAHAPAPAAAAAPMSDPAPEESAPSGPKGSFLNLPYGNDPARRLDLYLPARAGEAVPLVVLLHGGGWVEGSRQDCAATGEILAAAGYAAAAVEYRMIFKGAPIRAADILDDIDAALAWLRARAGEYGLEGRYALMGWSAGGHLSLLHGLMRRDAAGNPLATCIIDYFGPADLTLPAYREGSLEPLVRELCGGRFADVPEAWRKASPIGYVDAGAPPALIFHGQKDAIVPWEDSRDLADALRAKGAAVSPVLFPGGGHGDLDFDWVAAWAATIEWLGRWMPL